MQLKYQFFFVFSLQMQKKLNETWENLRLLLFDVFFGYIHVQREKKIIFWHHCLLLIGENVALSFQNRLNTFENEAIL